MFKRLVLIILYSIAPVRMNTYAVHFWLIFSVYDSIAVADIQYVIFDKNSPMNIIGKMEPFTANKNINGINTDKRSRPSV